MEIIWVLVKVEDRKFLNEHHCYKVLQQLCAAEHRTQDGGTIILELQKLELSEMVNQPPAKEVR